MLCYQARKRLEDYRWDPAQYRADQELLGHLQSCVACTDLIAAEHALRRDLDELQRAEPASHLPLESVRRKIETADTPKRTTAPALRRRVALIAAVAAVVFLAVVPFNVREKVGYEIAINGVGKEVAFNQQKASSLLDALGMEKGEAESLLDSLGVKQIQFSVGECSETCKLTISDLKTERDVRLMVKAIIDLGCCQIDNIVPIFRRESTNLLGLAARKLLS